jgi:hypothetical protein
MPTFRTFFVPAAPVSLFLVHPVKVVQTPVKIAAQSTKDTIFFAFFIILTPFNMRKR